MADYPLSYTGQQIDNALGEVINNQVVKTTRTVNGKALSNNITLTGADINVTTNGSTYVLNSALDNKVPTSAQINGIPFNNNITLRGSNIDVSNVDSTKIDVALNAKVPTSRTVNSKPLTSNITINAEEIPYSNSLIAAINTVKDALDTALGGISKIFFVDEDRNIDYDLSIEDGYFYINLVS